MKLPQLWQLSFLVASSALAASPTGGSTNAFPAPCEMRTVVNQNSSYVNINVGSYLGEIFAWGQGADGVESSSIFTTHENVSTPSNQYVDCGNTKSDEEASACASAKKSVQDKLNTRMAELVHIGVCR